MERKNEGKNERKNEEKNEGKNEGKNEENNKENNKRKNNNNNEHNNNNERNNSNNKRNDILLIGILVLLCMILGGIFLFGQEQSGERVVVWIDGKEYARYDLAENRREKLPGVIGDNQLTIEDGKVWMSEAVCPDHFCMKQGKINHNRQTITCLPGKIVIVIEGNEAPNVDIVGQ